ncbi:hypothetical protein PS943_01201 [Pseudomonas fluorescens]|uniref:Uncharacterized protein n=1 Tax=Pseudomonas fluorescens TaxID=294 RepID=A0A5E7W2B1_PSEFL|nr:hypothetical protein PS943_01201 [Pseudomonas fluorescens]
MSESIAQQIRGVFLFVGKIVMQVVASHSGAGQYMILAAIDDIQADVRLASWSRTVFCLARKIF